MRGQAVSRLGVCVDSVPSVPGLVWQALVALVTIKGGPGKLLSHNIPHHVVAPVNRIGTYFILRPSGT